MLLGLYVNFYAFSTFVGFIHTKQKLTISVPNVVAHYIKTIKKSTRIQEIFV